MAEIHWTGLVEDEVKVEVVLLVTRYSSLITRYSSLITKQLNIKNLNIIYSDEWYCRKVK